MKRKYIRHHGDYAIGENEKLYSEMAARGWRLTKRGVYFSRFHKAEPENLRYRIELASPGFMEECRELPDEQIALYEECGWQYITGHGLIHVFSAKEGGEAPEFYSDPRQQAATLKALRRNYRAGLMFPLVLLICTSILLVSLSSPEEALQKVLAKYNRIWFEWTAWTLFLGFLIAGLTYEALYGAFCTRKLYRSLKKGNPLNHNPQKKHSVHAVLRRVLPAACAVFLALTGAELLQYRKYDMPEAPDGPYLTLEDLGCRGERGDPPFNMDNANKVEFSASLLIKRWGTHEYIIEGGDSPDECWMFQDVYEFNSQKAAAKFVKTLMHTSSLAKPSDFRPVENTGLDAAYKAGNGLEYIAVKENKAYYIIFSAGSDRANAQTDVLTALSQKG